MNKKIVLLLLGVIACAMGIILFLQMEQRHTKRPLSEQSSPLSSVEQSTETSTLTPTPEPIENVPTLPTEIKSNLAVPSSETTEKMSIQPQDDPVQQKVAAQEASSTQQKDTLQEKAPIQQEAPVPVQVTAQKTTVSSAPSNTANTAPQAKENATEKSVAKKITAPVPVAKTDTSSGTTGTHEMSSLSVQISGNTVHVVIKANNTFAYKTMELSSPERLVIDLPGTWKKIATTATPKNRLLEKIRIGNQPSGPRMVLDLKTKPKKYGIYRVDNSTLEIVIE